MESGSLRVFTKGSTTQIMTTTLIYIYLLKDPGNQTIAHAESMKVKIHMVIIQNEMGKNTSRKC